MNVGRSSALVSESESKCIACNARLKTGSNTIKTQHPLHRDMYRITPFVAWWSATEAVACSESSCAPANIEGNGV